MESKLADTGTDWYDFGGGNKLGPIEGVPNGKIAALHCIRNGKFYYKVIELEGEVTESDLVQLKALMLTTFEEDVLKMEAANEQSKG